MSRRVRGRNQALCPDPSSLSAHALPGQRLNDHLLYPRPNTRHRSDQPPGGGAAGTQLAVCAHLSSLQAQLFCLSPEYQDVRLYVDIGEMIASKNTRMGALFLGA